jgi:hypothetical protein
VPVNTEQSSTISTWDREGDVVCVICPDCAFTFDADHYDEDGGYSCPACAEMALGPVVAAAQLVSDSNFRRLEHDLRKHGWVAQADQVQAFRKVLEDYNQAIPQVLPE